MAVRRRRQNLTRRPPILSSKDLNEGELLGRAKKTLRANMTLVAAITG